MTEKTVELGVRKLTNRTIVIDNYVMQEGKEGLGLFTGGLHEGGAIYGFILVSLLHLIIVGNFPFLKMKSLRLGQLYVAATIISKVSGGKRRL